jgi:hypothetical protein
MSYGSNEAVEGAEGEYREHCAKLIAQSAAQLVAAGDMGRNEAIKAVAEWLRKDREAVGDVTGVATIENVFPSPSKASPGNQVSAIASELLNAVREAADNL